VTGSATTEIKIPGENSTFLIVSLRYAGDVLLSTPLARSIKKAIPLATVDYLVFNGLEGLLEKNPFVQKVHTMPVGSKINGQLSGLWKRYDYSIGTNPSDRTGIFTIGGGKTSVGFFRSSRNEFWKKWLLTHCRHYDDQKHVVPVILSQLKPLGISPVPKVTMEYDEDDLAFVRGIVGSDPFVIFHPYSRVGYKCWINGSWAELAMMVRSKLGMRAIFTISPVPTDKKIIEEIHTLSPHEIDSFGQSLSFSQLAAGISMSSGFVGVDNVVTHIAASMEVPTVGLFGPTWVHHWGLWPNGFEGELPYVKEGKVQRHGNIVVVQKDWPCVPCNREVCELTGTQSMQCMVQITADEVFEQLAISIQGFTATADGRI